MTICNVLSTLPIGENTAVVIDGARSLFRNGIGVLDDTGKPYEVLSVGMDTVSDPENASGKTSLLIKGSFLSSKLWV